MMPCATVFLVTALAGLPEGTCTLQCEMTTAFVIVTSSDGSEGRAMKMDKAGEWLKVHRVGGRWMMVLQQETAQCLEGGTQW